MDAGFTAEHYRLIRPLGRGGMGEVFEAVDERTGQHVALKTLSSLTGETLLRFKNEFRVLQEVRHPNLIRLHELVAERGRWFYAMELVAGETLLDYVRRGDGGDGDGDGADPGTAPRGDGPREPDLGGTLAHDATAELAAAPRGGRRPPVEGGLGSPPENASAGFDEKRLVSTMAQLARGLIAVHEAGVVHRDVKPSNVLVTGEGRVILLDFGVAAEAGPAARITATQHIVGTLGYMAPEQAGGHSAGPEADWYAFGSVLYEALTGRLPFLGTAPAVLISKREEVARPPSLLAPGISPQLESLCMDLLQADPRRRPGGAEVKRRLDALVEEHPLAAPPPAPASPAVGPIFVGRRAELAALERAFDQARAGSPATLLVRGESGVGKSALLRRFAEEAVTARPSTVVLAGRCYASESIPYRAVDGAIDALSRILARMPRASAAALVPLHASLLLQMFPVLERVEALARAPAPRHRILDPTEMRNRAFGALRELLIRLAGRRPVILAVDDLQWADPDSLALLEAVMGPPDAPPLLFVATARSHAGPSPAPWELACARALPELAAIDLQGLPPEEARELASEVLRQVGGAAAAEADIDAVALEAAGHPLLLDVLIRHGQATRGTAGPGAPRLDEAIRARVERLAPSQRLILEMAAVAGGPISEAAAARATQLDLEELEREVAALATERLLRNTVTEGDRAFDVYHDRVREAVLARLPQLAPDRARDLHGVIARALESTGGSPEALAVHFRESGDAARAARHAERGADRAAEVLAFGRAAHLYRLALALGPLTPSDGRSLRRRLGDVLGHAGRPGEAAEAYLEAAEGGPDDVAQDLRRLAAQHLLSAGHIDAGIELLRTLLAASALHYPSTPLRALGVALWRRLRLRLRGFSHQVHREEIVPQSLLARIDLCYHVGLSVGLVDPIRGAGFQATGLLLALRAGEPYRLSRCLAVEAAYSATRGSASEARTEELLGAAEALAHQSGNPHAIAVVLGARGQSAALTGRFGRSLELCRQAERQFRERCTGSSREIATVRFWIARTLGLLGHLDELGRWLPDAIEDSRERGDLFGDTALHLIGAPLVLIAHGDVDGAQDVVNRALAQWSPRGFHVLHYYALLARAAAHFYRRDAGAASELLRAHAPDLKRSMLLRLQLIRVNYLDLTGRTALGTAAAGADRRAAARRAESAARRLERERVPWATGLAHIIRAGIAAWGVRPEAAIPVLRTAIAHLEDCDLSLHAVACRRRLGELTAGPDGPALIAQADDWLRDQGVVNPAAITDMLVPPIPT